MKHIHSATTKEKKYCLIGLFSIIAIGAVTLLIWLFLNSGSIKQNGLLPSLPSASSRAEQAASSRFREQMTQIPDGMNENEDQEIRSAALKAYAQCVLELFPNKDSMTSDVQFDADGSVHFIMTWPDTSNENQTITHEWMTFESIDEGFAYLYNNQQIDLEGNVLILQ